MLFAFSFLTACSTSSVVSAPPKKVYNKSFVDTEFRFSWEYDFSGKKEIIVRGAVTKEDSSEVETPLQLSITGLNSKGKRLKMGSNRLTHLAMDNYEKFEIRIPNTGEEKSFLFNYVYDLEVDASSGAIPMVLWFEDSPDPAFVPKMVINPPSYRRARK